MTFAVLETEFDDANGELVVVERQTVIETDGPVSDNHAPQKRPERDVSLEQATVRQPNAQFDPVESTDSVEVGDSGPTVIVGDFFPQDFIRYAGTSGDFNPIHYDSQYTQRMGNPGVFGQGMLTAGHASHFVADWFGLHALRGFRTRFTVRVWPGDTLTVRGEVAGIDGDEVSAELTVSRQTTDTVLVGDVAASVGVEPCPPSGRQALSSSAVSSCPWGRTRTCSHPRAPSRCSSSVSRSPRPPPGSPSARPFSGPSSSRFRAGI